MALSDYSPAQEPVAYGAAVTAVVALAALLFKLDAGVAAGIEAAAAAVIGLFVRSKVTPVVTPPAPPANPLPPQPPTP